MTTVRQAGADDYPHFARLVPELGVDDPVPSREKWRAELQGRTVVAERGGAVLGVCYFQVLQGSGYVRQLMVDPKARRQGVGRALLDAVRAQVAAAGGTRWCLNVKPENLPAVRLYEAVGMRLQYRSAALRFPWSLVDSLPLEASEAREVTAADDARVEAALGLPRGQLADGRVHGRVLRWLCGGRGEVQGVAVFHPDFPGAFPFRVAAPGLARALLEALRPLRRPDLDGMGVVVEDDAALVALLRGAGAQLKLEFVHYDGPLQPQ